MKAYVLSCAFLVVASAVNAEELKVMDLWNLCARQEKVDLLVEETPEDAVNAGLTRARILNVAESRLRAARIFGSSEVATQEQDAYLHVEILAFSRNENQLVYGINLSFRQILSNFSIARANYGETWRNRSIGIGGADFVMQHVSEKIDSFIREYLRVRLHPECTALNSLDDYETEKEKQSSTE